VFICTFDKKTPAFNRDPVFNGDPVIIRSYTVSPQDMLTPFGYDNMNCVLDYELICDILF